MKSYFPDVNLWVALISSGHSLHQPALSWFRSAEVSRLGFCRITQLSFLRLLTNPIVMRDEVLTARAAWNAYDLLFEDGRVGFYEEPATGELLPEFRHLTASNHFVLNQWPDAYLAAFAKAAGLVLVTFDRGLKSLAGREALLLP